LGSNGAAANCAPGVVPTSAQACLIDFAIENAGTTAKSGYLLTVAVAGGGFAANNNPQTPGSSGVRYFFTDQSLVIRQNSTAAATAGDSPI
jgi:type IV pilus assembly protein PilA